MGLVQSFFEINSGNNSDINKAISIEDRSKLLDTLDDYCLREIFKYLTLLDLLAAAEVCIRFNQHANDAFNAKYKHVLNIDSSFELNGQLDETEAVLRHFGQLIRSLSIISTDIYFRTAAAAVQMINKHTTTALTELHLSGVDISKYAENLRPVFMKLESFRLDNCTLTPGVKGLFGHAFPKLEKAQFNWCIDLKHSDLELFIELNPKLKVLVIRDKYWTEDSAQLINLIGENLSNLEELELEVDKWYYYSSENRFQKTATSYSGRLSSLKVLKLNCGGRSDFIAPLINESAKNKVPIEHLKLITHDLDSTTIKSVSQFKQIKTLELNFDWKLSEHSLIELAKELPLLEKFYLIWSYRYFSIDGLVEMLTHAKNLSHFELDNIHSINIDENAYVSILKAIRDRPEKNHLSIKISSGEFNVPAHIVSKNRHLLCIDVNAF